ncbi:carotenoid oxygenase family protein [Streptomyces sp. NPDC048416]|uniref:carotenoid oxygenase family protein n=1 Tax=Streptomyces sp. NPDC048416 TaxID=3365546 RepID=UPI003713BAA0
MGGAPNTQAGNYRPVSREVTVHQPEVVGQLPPELNGTFTRIGPNPLGPPDPRRHAFEGAPMVHAIRLQDGRAQWYRNRWLRTDRVCAQLGELPTPGPRHGLSDDAGGNLVQHAGRILALGDGGVLPVQIGTDLATAARVDFDGTLVSGFSAHPETDPLTGEMFAVAHYHEPPYVLYLAIGADGRVRRSLPIAVKSPPMMHAFSLTERYAVFYDLPVAYDPAAAAGGSRIPYRWRSDHGSRIGVLPREATTPDVLWMDVDPCYVFHPLNAYESANRIVIHLVRHPRVFDREPLRPGETAPTLWRWTIDPRAGTVVEKQLEDYAEEFPRIDDRYKQAYNRYGFAVAMSACGSGGHLAGPSLLRHDLALGRTDIHEFGPGRESGEAVFVPRGHDAAEADGWLLSLVYDAADDRSELVVLDTADFTGEPAAVVRLPVRVPHGLHATWIAG